MEFGHLLVVDDNRMNRLTLLRSVQQLGHTGAVAEDGHQALEMLEAGPFDIVLLDIMMPGMDGFQVLERLKGDADLRDIPVIVISGLEEMESAARCIELGAEDFLTKPFNSTLLRARLNASLEKKRYRDLEKAYLQQEIMLRQSEKLATLGKLAAGMAHELNNPAAAARRGVEHLSTISRELRQINLRLAESGLNEEQSNVLAAFERDIEGRVAETRQLDPLAHSECEAAVEACLLDLSVERPWDHTAALIDVGLDEEELRTMLNLFTAAQVPNVVAWLSVTSRLYVLLKETRDGLQRVTAIVEALKTYTYLDQAPIQLVSVHDGIDSSLAMLSIPPTSEILVQRDYANELPRVEANGSELNQVWSSILDNAVDALEESGRIRISTVQRDGAIVVEIEDDGPGIPAEIQSKIFDPFFTTKPPGHGAGLGLTLSYNIIQKHDGKLEVYSQPGSTRVTVTIPVEVSATP